MYWMELANKRGVDGVPLLPAPRELPPVLVLKLKGRVEGSEMYTPLYKFSQLWRWGLILESCKEALLTLLKPPKADADILVARYFDFAMVTHRFLHRPTIEAWIEEFYDNLGVMKQKDGAKGRIALLFMVFAQAKNYMPPTQGNDTR